MSNKNHNKRAKQLLLKSRRVTTLKNIPILPFNKMEFVIPTQQMLNIFWVTQHVKGGCIPFGDASSSQDIFS